MMKAMLLPLLQPLRLTSSWTTFLRSGELLSVPALHVAGDQGTDALVKSARDVKSAAREGGRIIGRLAPDIEVGGAVVRIWGIGRVRAESDVGVCDRDAWGTFSVLKRSPIFAAQQSILPMCRRP